MVQLYFNKILDGTITIDAVPKLWKAKVQAKLDEYYASIIPDEEEVIEEVEETNIEEAEETDSEEPEEEQINEDTENA